MNEFQDFKRKFSNNRQWREFVTAVHESVTYPCAVTYPKVISALRRSLATAPDANKYCTEWRAEIPPA